MPLESDGSHLPIYSVINVSLTYHYMSQCNFFFGLLLLMIFEHTSLINEKHYDAIITDDILSKMITEDITS